ncbi:hypothetical protein WDW89_03395 [Deltaproteobacteria bacterium TL4]
MKVRNLMLSVSVLLWVGGLTQVLNAQTDTSSAASASSKEALVESVKVDVNAKKQEETKLEEMNSTLAFPPKGKVTPNGSSNAASKETSTKQPQTLTALSPADDAEKTQKAMTKPFEQIKELPKETSEVSSEFIETPYEQKRGEVRLPSTAEQQFAENALRKKLHELLKPLLLKKYVSVTVSSHYVIQTLPISESHKQISRIKLPGFSNHVWVPTETKNVLGLVNQLQVFKTVFIVVNSALSSFEVEVLRQSLDAQVDELNLGSQDRMEIAYVPSSSSQRSEMVSEEQPQTDETKKSEKTAQKDPQQKPTEEPVDPLFSMPVPLEPVAKAGNTPDPESESRNQDAEFKSAKRLLEARQEFFKQDYSKALDKIQQAIEYNPRSAQAYAMLGSIYYRLKWKSLAAKHWKKSLELDPSNAVIVQYLERLGEGE